MQDISENSLKLAKTNSRSRSRSPKKVSPRSKATFQNSHQGAIK